MELESGEASSDQESDNDRKRDGKKRTGRRRIVAHLNKKKLRTVSVRIEPLPKNISKKKGKKAVAVDDSRSTSQASSGSYVSSVYYAIQIL